MEINERDRVRRLHRLFKLYERAEERFARGEIAPPEMARLTVVLRQLSFDFWRGFFGASVDAPAHQRHVLSWSARNLEVFRRLGVLGEQEAAAVREWIGRALARLEGDDPRYDFASDGPKGASADALRRLYLIQNLNIRLETCVRAGSLAAQVQDHVRRDLMRRARTLFSSVLQGEIEDLPRESAAVHAMLEEYVTRGLLTPAALAALDPEARTAPRPAAAGEPIPLAVLVELLRRTGTEGPAAATLLDALARNVQTTQPPPSQEALAAAVARLGLPGELAAETEPPPVFIDADSEPDVAVYTDIQLGEVTSTAVDGDWAEEVGQEMLAAGIKAPGSTEGAGQPEAAPSSGASSVESGAAPAEGPHGAGTPQSQGGPSTPQNQGGPSTPPSRPPRTPPPSRPPGVGPRNVRSSPRATPGRPQMWGSAPEAAPAAPSFWESVLSAMIEELGVNWLLFSGVILVVAAGVLLAVKHWTEIRPFEQYLVILGGTLTFFALAMVTRLAMKLERTPTALFAVVLTFVPLNMVAIDMLQLLGPGDHGPALLAKATAMAGLVVVAVMVLWGGKAICGLKPTVFAPALLSSSAAYLVVSLAEASLLSPWARLGAIVATVLAARSCLPSGTRDLQRAGMLPVVLSALSLATAAAGLRSGHDLLTIGLTVTAVAHLWLEAGHRLATLAQGPLEESPGALPRILTTLGQLLVLAGACLSLLPQPHHNPLGLLALAYASRALYTAFFTHRTGFTFLTFLVTPGPLLYLLPDATAQLSQLWRTPLVEYVTRNGFDPLFVDLLPLVLVGPFHAHLAARLARRGLEAPRALLHVMGAAVAVITLIVTFLPAWLGALTAALTVLIWGGLSAVHTDPAEKHLAGVAALGGAALVIEGIRLLQLPEWVWLLTAVLLAYVLLALHLRARALGPDAPPSRIPHALGDFLFPASLTTAFLSLAAYFRALSLGQVLGDGGAGYDASLVLLALYFAVSLYAHYNAARALMTVPLLALEAWVLLIRFDQVHVTNAGYWVGLTALFPWAVGLALDSHAGRAFLEKRGPRALRHDSVRDALVTFHCGLTQAAATAAFWIPPVDGWLGSGKYILLAAVHGLLIRRLPSNALQSFLCFMVGFHIPLRTMLHQPWPCLTLQLMDLIAGLMLLANARRLHARLPAAAGDAPLIQIAGSLLLVVSTAIYLVGPFLYYNSDPIASFLASAAQVALGGGLIGLAWVLDSELAVYAGEVAIMLVYARLFIQGYIPRTLVMGFISLGLSFVLLFMRERLFSQPRYRVYRNPAANTALVLPLFTVLRGLEFSGPVGAVLVFMAGVFYHMASWRGGQPQCLYFGLLLYNVSSAMLPAGPGFLGACRYLVPVGITLLVYTHTPGTGLSRDQISGWRMLGTALIVGEPLPRALLGTRDDIAFLLLIGLAIGIAMAGLVLRVRLYLGAGTGLFVLAVLSFVAKQIFQTTHLGLFSLLILGVILIFAGAVFEQARARLRHLATHLKTRFQDWD